jgi:alpha-tubulin suppressor-like RCC1 family protein
VASLPGPAAEVVAGHGKTCARLKTGDVYCWGHGPLGNGEPETLGVAVKVLHAEGAVSIGVGTHACAVDGEGAVWCWGDNWVGESGLPWTTYVLTPVRVRGVPPAKLVVAGGAHTCALTREHEVYCWGSNVYGEIGIGRGRESTHIPQLVEVPIEMP